MFELYVIWIVNVRDVGVEHVNSMRVLSYLLFGLLTSPTTKLLDVGIRLFGKK